MKKTILFSASILFSFSTIFSQSIERMVIGSSGNYYSSGSIQLSWTAGEVVTATVASGSVILTQGFQQPNEISSSVNLLAVSDLLDVFPNPSYGILNLRLSNSNLKDSVLYIEVYDAVGKIVYSTFQKAVGIHAIDVSNLPGGIYNLAVTLNGSKRGVFKISIVK